MAQFTEEELSQLLQGRRKIHRVEMPGMPGTFVGVRVLLDQEVDDARIEAQKYLQARCKKQGFDLKSYIDADPDALDREHQRQTIWRAFVDPDSDASNPAPFFPSDAMVRQLDSSTIQRLWEIYLDWLDVMDPRFRLNDEQLDELFEALKKGQGADRVLAQYAPDSLASLLRITVRRLLSSQTGKSSDGS